MINGENIKPNPHDLFGREMLSEPDIAGDVLKHYLPPEIAECVDFDSLEPAPAQFFGPEFKDFYGDVAFATHLRAGQKTDVVVHVELKSRSHRFALLQILVYLVLYWYAYWQKVGSPTRKQFRLPAAVCVLLCNGEYGVDENMSFSNIVENVPVLAQCTPQFRPFVVNLKDYEYGKLPGSPVTQAVMEAMKRAGDGMFAAHLEDVLLHFREVSFDQRIMHMMKKVIYYCDQVDKTLSPDIVGSAIRRSIKGKGDINMMLSEFKGNFVRSLVNEIIAEERAEGLSQGISQGLSQGITKGKVLAFADIVARKLTKRFPTCPPSVQYRISDITDVDKLDELIDLTWTCNTLDDFVAELDKK